MQEPTTTPNGVSKRNSKGLVAQVRTAHALGAGIGRLEEEVGALVELCTAAKAVHGVPNVSLQRVPADRLAALCECAESSIVTAETAIREEILALTSRYLPNLGAPYLVLGTSASVEMYCSLVKIL